MGGAGIGSIIVLGILAFICFCIYFIFKQLEFVLKSINLYERMVSRQDMMVKLLKEIRDANPLGLNSTSPAKLNTKPKVSSNRSSNFKFRNFTEKDFKDKILETYSKGNLEECKELLEGLNIEIPDNKYMPFAGNKKLEEINKKLSLMKDELLSFSLDYENFKKKIIAELEPTLKSYQETVTLQSMSRLAYNDLIDLGSKPEDFSETESKVYKGLIEKINLYKDLSQKGMV
jgi:tRNA splicing endonuclease